MALDNDDHQLYLIDFKNFVKDLEKKYPNNAGVICFSSEILLKIACDQNLKFWKLEKRIKGEKYESHLEY